MVRHLRKWTNPFQKKMISYQNNWIRKKLVLWNETNQGQMEPFETAGVITCIDSEQDS